MPKDWKELSEAVSREQDPQKLLELVEELDKALEQHEKAIKEKTAALTKTKLTTGQILIHCCLRSSPCLPEYYSEDVPEYFPSCARACNTQRISRE